MCRFKGIVLALAMCLPSVGGAEVFNAQPEQVAVTQEEDADAVIMLFNVSSLDLSPGAQVDEAILTWEVEGLSSTETSEFQAFAVTNSWTSESAEAPPIDSVAVAEWVLTPASFEANGGGLVRLDVTNLVRSWLTNSLANHGILIRSSHWSGEEIVSESASAELVVRYASITVPTEADSE